jgi:hypothetical protein
MQALLLSSNHFLDNFILNIELSKIAKISGNAYKYWKNGVSARFEGGRSVFLQRSTLPQKYTDAANKCTLLHGCVPAQAFCTFTGCASSHLIQANGSKLYEKLHIFSVCGIKFVDLKRFYDDLGLPYHLQIYIEKCHFFAPSPLEKKIKLTDTLCVGYY